MIVHRLAMPRHAQGAPFRLRTGLGTSLIGAGAAIALGLGVISLGGATLGGTALGAPAPTALRSGGDLSTATADAGPGATGIAPPDSLGTLRDTPSAAVPAPDAAAPIDMPIPEAAAGVQTVPLGAIVDAPGTTAPRTPTPDADRPAGSLTVTTAAVHTDDFTVAGVTWDPADEPEAVRLRTYVDGEWTPWQDLEIAARSGGPVPDSDEGDGAVGGTEPFVAAGSTGAQVQVVTADDALASSVAAQFIDPESLPDDAAPPAPFGRSAGTVAGWAAAQTDPAVPGADGTDSEASVPETSEVPTGAANDVTTSGASALLPSVPSPSAPGETPSEAPSSTPPPSPDPSPTPSSEPTGSASPTPPAPQAPTPEPPAPDPAPTTPPAAPPPQADPVIHSRDEWGANEARVRQKPKYFGTLRGAIVHHTAGSNIYTPEQVPGVVRGIFNYHVGSLKWNDIGYNFLVDKYGGIWEGRAGGIDANVVGAHANHFNSETFGVSVLGNYEKVEPTPESIAALTSIVGWRLAVAGIHNPAATTTYATNGKELPVIIGHSDAAYRRGGVSYNATSCPGQYLYPYLETLRAGAVYPVVDRPGIAGPSDVTPGEIGTYTLTWGSTSGPVSGVVEVQRFNGSTWASMARVDVAGGVGQWQVRPSGVYTYRAVALAVAEPVGWRLPPKTTSASLVTTRVISRGATRTPRLLVPSYAPAGKVTTAVALWANPYDKPSTLELQIRKGNKWVKVKNVTVDGVRLFKIKVSATAKYRLKAHRVSAPAKGKLRASKSAKIRVWS